MRRFLPPFFLGFLSMSLQVLVVREYSVHFQGNEMTYGFLLAAWLFWGGLGSLLAHRLKIHPGRFANLLCLVLLLMPACLAGLRFSSLALGRLPSEVMSPTLMFVFALVLALLLSFPFGLVFVAAVRMLGGDASLVYSLESLGAAAGGLAVYLFLVPYVSNWRAAGLLGLAALAAMPLLRVKRAHPLLQVCAALALASLVAWDTAAQRLYWKPLELIRVMDTPYGRLQAVRTGEDVSLYINGVPDYSSGDSSSAEEAVHFALLQRPRAERALLLGGGAGGGLKEALKYPGLRLDYVELDPEIIRMSEEILPPDKRSVFHHPRVQIHYRDGRTFVSRTAERYDAILLCLPEPSTAQLNRFYTRQFFELAKSRLTPEGVFSFRLPSAENYLSPLRAMFLSSLHHTLKAVFPEVKVVPGETNIFLASSLPLTLDVAMLGREADRLGLKTTYVRREILENRLNPPRVDLLRKTLARESSLVNTDLVPLCYFYVTALWASQFPGLESALLERLYRADPASLILIPLSVVIIILIVLRLRAGKRAALLAPLALLGLSGITSEILILLRYQTLYGVAYGRMALLLALFMGGLWLGSWMSRKSLRPSWARVKSLQTGLTVLAGLIVLSLILPPSEPVLLALVLAFGTVSGGLFVTANALYIKKDKDHGTGYGLDLLGSFLGALAASAFLIPLAGLMLTALLLMGMNILILAFLLSYSPGALA